MNKMRRVVHCVYCSPWPDVADLAASAGWQTRQRIVKRQIADFILFHFALGDIAGQKHHHLLIVDGITQWLCPTFNQSAANDTIAFIFNGLRLLQNNTAADGGR